MADAPHVIDIRNIGLMGAIELASRDSDIGTRGMEAHIKCFEFRINDQKWNGYTTVCAILKFHS